MSIKIKKTFRIKLIHFPFLFHNDTFQNNNVTILDGAEFLDK
ncbi:uncharacterized protein METZ01_LOCUS349284 [marine metagenome]|uniref:Uncharacterized protein n=1 Tax=marine metagenome TaxID=408172 RepID=A0A382RGB6_9ZZZZ